MSATRDLIAAAPDMGEVERLLEAYDREYASGGSVEDYDCARTALLDYVRGVIAERDELIAAHAGDTKKMARDERQLFESWIVRECGPGETKRWLNTEVYENMRVNDYRTGWVACLGLMSATTQPVSEVNAVDGIPVQTGHAEADRLIGRLMSSDPDYDDCADAAALIQREIKGPDGFATWREAALAERIKRTQQPVSAVEVPMPEPDCVTFSRTSEGFGVRSDALRMDSAIRYGEQCRAAGEAAGYARGLKEVNTALNDVFSAADGLSSAIDAALHGEVKP